MITFNCVFLSLALLCFGCYGDEAAKKPNIILIITDDQDSVLEGITPMKRTQDLIGKRGATFLNSFVASPICCPSRSSILTGMYSHNHGTTNNSISGGCSNSTWQRKFEPKTFATILQKQANYQTFYAGKYLNMYGMKASGGPQHVPPGWSRWRGLVGNSRYYNFTLSHDGVPMQYGDGMYLTDVIKLLSLEFLDEESKRGFENPFLMVLAPPAPHAPFTAAIRHKAAFAGVKALQTPNFNVPAGKDKHWLLQMPPAKLTNTTLTKLDDIYKKRWQALLSVDEMVSAVVKSLHSKNILNNTYIIFTSDNGYHIGQFAQPFDKRQPYETDIRVPLLIRGPGIEQKKIVHIPTVNIDLAPTILSMAGLPIPKDMDGAPLAIFSPSVDRFTDTSDISDSHDYERIFAIEYSGEGSNKNELSNCPHGSDTDLFNCDPEYDCKCQDSRNNTYSCVRHLHPVINIMYCEFNDKEGFVEAYDVNKDPYQMTNIGYEMLPAIKYKYQTILKNIKNCKGEGCNNFLMNIV